jgi:hypothetical protein
LFGLDQKASAIGDPWVCCFHFLVLSCRSAGFRFLAARFRVG